MFVKKVLVPEDDLRLARGIVMGVLLSLPLWGVLGLLWWWVG